jgi:mono/diheme cytochrome c family protein
MTADDGDPARGKALFVEHCQACHTLADAKAAGKVGPDLDEAFKYDKKQGFDVSTIRDVVRGQIAYSTSSLGTKDAAGNDNPGMPPNLVTGQDARDVAEYVAKCSGIARCGVQAASTQ